VAWGVHVHRCSSKSGPTPTCSKCQAPLNNTHLLGGCSHTAKLRTKRHNSTFLLLHQLLQKSNGGRWPVIGIDLGKTPITDFRNTKPKTDDTTLSNFPPITHPEQEGLQDDKNADGETPHIIPEYILPAQPRPTHHKPDIIRAIGYFIGPDGTLKEDPTYKGRRQLQLIECKYSTDGNITDIIDHIHTIYEPLKQALQTYGTLKADIKIIPIVISRTGTFHVKTLAEIAQLISFEEEPPDALTYKQLPKPAQQIAMTLHIHAQEWLSHISKISRTILTTKQKHNTKKKQDTMEKQSS
jgi:hypothetical protein